MSQVAFVDTNIFLRYLTNDDQDKAQACYALLQQASQQQLRLFTSEAVVTEIVYVLLSRKHYRLTREEISSRLHPILTLPGLKIIERTTSTTYLRSLDLFVQYSFDFEDCLSLAYMEQLRITRIYSYDRELDRITGITRLEPSSTTPAASG